MILWLLQDVGKSQMLKDNFETVRELKFNYANIGVLADSNIISGLEQALRPEVSGFILRGGVKLIELIYRANTLEELIGTVEVCDPERLLDKLKKGVFYSINNFDQDYYSTLGLPLLNHDAFCVPISENLNKTFDKDYFIKPTKDLKTLDPGILKAGVSIEQFILSTAYRKEIYAEKLLIAPVKSILAEYRFFVINEKIVAGSQYKLADKVQYSNTIPSEVLNTAAEYAKLYQPHDIFTMDLAVMLNGDIRIVEYNCWNGSGLYASDKKTLFSAVKEYMANNL